MSLFDKKIFVYLASESPRRKELLSSVGISYECVCHAAEEKPPADLSPEKTAEYLARQKAQTATAPADGRPILASDTIVVLDGKIYGKPSDRKEAFKMLKELSGRIHRVYTAVAIKTSDATESFTSMTEVEFFELSEGEINEYLDKGEYADKAGAYGIQGFGSVLVKRINGDFYTVMGLPVAESYRRLCKLV